MRASASPALAQLATLAALACCLAASAAPAQSAPANTIHEMYAQMNRCMAGVRLTEGADVTVRFMLNRRGAVIGKPRITYGHWTGDDADRRATAASIAESFDRCLPARITDALGGAIAGRLIVYRFRSGREEKA